MVKPLRLCSMALVSLLVVASAAACSSTSSNKGSGNKGSGSSNLTWWGWNVSDVKGMIASFEKAHPNIKVTFKEYKNADYPSALTPALRSNSGPDVFQVQPGALVTKYAPLALDLTSYEQGAHGTGWKSVFNSQGVSQLAVGGKQVGMPSYMSAAGLLWYNQKIFDQNNIAIPSTLSEFVAACQRLKAKKVTCMAHGAKDGWVNEDLFITLANNIAPGVIYQAIAGKLSWTDSRLEQAMSAYKSLFSNGVIEKGATAVAQYPDADNMFLTGKAATILLGTWNDFSGMTNAGLKLSSQGLDGPIAGTFRSIVFPGPNGNSSGGLFGGPDNGWAISQSSKQKGDAFTFVDWLTGQPDGGVAFQAKAANFPALNGVQIGTADVTAAGQKQDIASQQSLVNNLVGSRQIPYPDLDAAVTQALSGVAGGTQSPNAALGSIQQVSSTTSRS